MNKPELVKRIAKEADISEQVAEKALDATLKGIEESFQRGEIPAVIRKFVQTILLLTPTFRSGRSTREISAQKTGVIKKPAAKPIAKKPAAKKPAAKKPAAKKPAAKKPATGLSGSPTGGGGPGKKR